MTMTQLCLLLVSCLAVTRGLQLPSVVLPGTGAGHQICNYQYAIPQGGNCLTYGPALETKVEALQRDVDKARLQFVSQNSILREELRKIRQQSSATDAQVTDLTKELKNVGSSLAAVQASLASSSHIPTGGGVNMGGGSGGGGGAVTASNAMLQQLVRATRTQLTTDILKLEHSINAAVATVQADRQRDAVQQSQVDQVLQSQLRQQQQDLTRLFNGQQQLTNRLNYLSLLTPKPSLPHTAPTQGPTQGPSQAPFTTAAGPVVITSGAGTGPSSVQVQNLQSQLQQLQKRLASVENVTTNQIPQLTSEVALAQEMAHNSSLTTSDVKIEMDYVHHTLVTGLQKNMSVVYGLAGQLNAQFQRDFVPLQNQVNVLAKNITGLSQQLSTLGTSSFTHDVELKDDAKKIKDLEAQLGRLQASLKSQGITTPKPTVKVPTPRPKTTVTFPAVPTRQPGSG